MNRTRLDDSREQGAQSRRRQARSAVVAAGLLGLMLGLNGFAAGSAGAGELAFKGCITGDQDIARFGPCRIATENDVGSGLGNAGPLAATPDGESLYAGSTWTCTGLETEYCDSGVDVASLDRDPATGRLDYRGCITGTENSQVCGQIHGATPSGLNSGMGAVDALAASPDGGSVYAASAQICDDSGCLGTDAITSFRRAPDGALTYRGCVSGDPDTGPSGTDACVTPGGGNVALLGFRDLTVSPDGRSLYAAAVNDLAVFDRDPSTGRITYRGCISGNEDLAVCAHIRSARSEGIGSGLLYPYAVVVSPNGKSVYVVAHGDKAVARFHRNATTGELSYRDCITAALNVAEHTGACEATPDATHRGDDTGMGDLLTAAISPDGRSLYTGSSHYDYGITRFDADPVTGKLTWGGCIPGGRGSACRSVGRLPTFPTSIVVSPDGRSLYSGAYDSVIRFKRDPSTGELEPGSCVTGVKGSGVCAVARGATADGEGSGIGATWSIATGSSVYGSLVHDAVVGHYALAPQTKITGGPRGPEGRRRVTFRFRAGVASTFECKLEGDGVGRKRRHWRPCGQSSPAKHGRKRYRHLRPGKKVFRVRATDRSHTTDPTPAERHWRVR